MSSSFELFSAAKSVIAGGVNSPVRSFYGVGGHPLFIKSAKGAYLTSEEGDRYIDYVGAWGPMILGHAHPAVIAATQNALEQGLGFGTPTVIETTLATKITTLMPSIELVRMVNSGTEATMSAIRLARGFTGRNKILKFAGCYHGHSDALLVKAGSGALTFGVPSSAGVPHEVAKHTLNATYNDLSSVERCFESYPKEIACVIVEPIAGNMNCVPARIEFLQGIRKLCDEYGALLIFDEVMTGFRITPHGAQHYYGITPDLTCLGKIVGGGMPVGAFGGKREIMQHLAPLGPVYQAGTLSGNPIAMCAGLATLEQLASPPIYEKLQASTKQLVLGLQAVADKYAIAFTTNHVHSMFGFFFSEQKSITNFDEVMACDAQRFKQFFHGMLAQGIYFAPSAFECGFVSLAHDNQTLEKTLAAADNVMKGFSSCQ